MSLDSGPLKLALRTETAKDGNPYSVVGLFPAGLPATGKACDVRLGIDKGDRTLMLGQWNGPHGLQEQKEIEAHLKSVEYSEAKQVAASLDFDHLG
ncbi:hypothetical protein [Paeniglutamicibacter sp. NPDC091659]|uniref:hypothetical protein n=1 Tax=Paeniglutamicibacter sp. NPDC091659 TaxID=3364389 RepID=UPI00381A812F